MVAAVHPESNTMTPSLDSVMELSFLVSRTQFEALELAAERANLSVAQFLRRLVQSSVDSSSRHVVGMAPSDD